MAYWEITKQQLYHQVREKTKLDDAVWIRREGKLLKLKSNKAEMKLVIFAEEQYPNIDFSFPKNSFSAAASMLEDAIDKTIFSASDQQTRPVLGGLNFHITERFSNLYMGESQNVFFDDELKFVAVYDRERDQLFNVDTRFYWIIEKGSFDIPIDDMNFEALKKDLLSEIKNSVQGYALENADTLEKEALSAYQNQEPYRFKRSKENGIIYFLTHDCDFLKEDSSLENQIRITDGIYCNLSKLQDSPDWTTNKVLLGYLTDKISTIEQESNKILADKDFRLSIGTSILNSRFTADVVSRILENEKGEYDLLYKKKAMIEALEKKDGVNVIITITYGKDSLDFKFSRARLLSSLKQADTSDIGDYGKAYEKVEKFLREHKQDQSSWHRDDFDFQNISRITYSGKQLYVDDTSLKNESKTKDRKQIRER